MARCSRDSGSVQNARLLEAHESPELMVPNLGTEPRYSTVVGAQKPGHHRESIENPKGESSSWSPRPLFDIACSSCADDSAAALPAKRQRNHDLNIRESRYHRFWYRKPLRSPVVKLFFFNTTTEHQVSQGPIRPLGFGEGLVGLLEECAGTSSAAFAPGHLYPTGRRRQMDYSTTAILSVGELCATVR